MASSSSIHIDPPNDSEISGNDRNRLTRIITSFGIGIGSIAVPTLASAVVGGMIFGGVGSWIFALAGFAGGGFFLERIINRLFVYNEEWTAYVTQDPFTGRNIPYGPGLHPAHFWEERNATGQYDMKVKTKTFSVAVPTTTTQATINGSYQYAIDIEGLLRFIGTGKEVVEQGLDAFIEQYLTQSLTQMAAEDARKDIKTIDADLRNEFMGNTGSVDFESKYGITIANLVVNTVALPKEVQTTRDAVGEAKTLMEVVAQLSGMKPEVYQQKRESGAITDERHKQLLDRAMAVSDNKTSVSVNVIEGGGGVTPMLPLKN